AAVDHTVVGGQAHVARGAGDVDAAAAAGGDQAQRRRAAAGAVAFDGDVTVAEQVDRRTGAGDVEHRAVAAAAVAGEDDPARIARRQVDRAIARGCQVQPAAALAVGPDRQGAAADTDVL